VIAEEQLAAMDARTVVTSLVVALGLLTSGALAATKAEVMPQSFLSLPIPKHWAQAHCRLPPVCDESLDGLRDELLQDDHSVKSNRNLL
jgi:hypothetical protein